MKHSTENLALSWPRKGMLIEMLFCACTRKTVRGCRRMLKMQDFTTLHEGEFTAGATGSTCADSDRCAAMRIEVLI